MVNELIELLKEVLALYGIRQGDYPKGLLERGVLYRELGDIVEVRCVDGTKLTLTDYDEF